MKVGINERDRRHCWWKKKDKVKSCTEVLNMETGKINQLPQKDGEERTFGEI